MCGVVAYAGEGGAEARARFVRLCKQSSIRGVHAFGLAWWIPGEGVTVTKGLRSEDVLARLPEEMPKRVIWHNRYSTSGDHTEMRNNQPISVEGVVLAFNGTVDMGTKPEMESRSGYRLDTDNDGELVLRDWMSGDPWRRIGRGSQATFAGVILTGSGALYAMRNDLRPLWCYREPGHTFICSTKDIAARAKFDKNYLTELNPYEVTEIGNGQD